MSFDVYLEVAACEHCGRDETSEYSFNITHNVNRIVDICLVAGGATKAKRKECGYAEWSWGRLDGWTAADVLPMVRRAREEMGSPARLAEFKALEPDNGWGTLVDTKRITDEFIAALEKYPRTTVRTWG